jgi:hypothetical protein
MGAASRKQVEDLLGGKNRDTARGGCDMASDGGLFDGTKAARSAEKSFMKNHAVAVGGKVGCSKLMVGTGLEDDAGTVRPCREIQDRTVADITSCIDDISGVDAERQTLMPYEVLNDDISVIRIVAKTERVSETPRPHDPRGTVAKVKGA